MVDLQRKLPLTHTFVRFCLVDVPTPAAACTGLRYHCVHSDGPGAGVTGSGEGGNAAAGGTPFPAGCSGRSCRLVHRRTLRGHLGPVPFVAWSPDDTLLATCSELSSHDGLDLDYRHVKSKVVSSDVWNST